MSLPNILTFSRIVFLFVIAGLLFIDCAWSVTLALVLFVIGALTDWADGYVARRMQLVSDFGKLMDALADKVLMTGIFVVFLSVRLVPDWTVFLILFMLMREFLVTGLRLVAASSGEVLAAERSGKIKTVVQMIAAILILMGACAQQEWNMGSAVTAIIQQLGLGMYVLSTCLTITSGLSYLLKYKHFLLGGK